MAPASATMRGLFVIQAILLRTACSEFGVVFDVREWPPSALISFPLRYMHSVVEMADLRDVEKTIELIAAFVESVTEDDDFAHRL